MSRSEIEQKLYERKSLKLSIHLFLSYIGVFSKKSNEYNEIDSESDSELNVIHEIFRSHTAIGSEGTMGLCRKDNLL